MLAHVEQKLAEKAAAACRELEEKYNVSNPPIFSAALGLHSVGRSRTELLSLQQHLQVPYYCILYSTSFTSLNPFTRNSR